MCLKLTFSFRGTVTNLSQVARTSSVLKWKSMSLKFLQSRQLGWLVTLLRGPMLWLVSSTHTHIHTLPLSLPLGLSHLLCGLLLVYENPLSWPTLSLQTQPMWPDSYISTISSEPIPCLWPSGESETLSLFTVSVTWQSHVSDSRRSLLEGSC